MPLTFVEVQLSLKAMGIPGSTLFNGHWRSVDLPIIGGVLGVPFDLI